MAKSLVAVGAAAILGAATLTTSTVAAGFLTGAFAGRRRLRTPTIPLTTATTATATAVRLQRLLPGVLRRICRTLLCGIRGEHRGSDRQWQQWLQWLLLPSPLSALLPGAALLML